jgi:glycosyltransferase involved in cell wall biosynthesis
VIDVVNGLPFATPLVRRSGVVALVHHLHREQWHIIYPGLAGRVGWFVESRLVPRAYRSCAWLTVSQSTAADLAGIGVAPDCMTIARNGWQGTVLDTPKSPTPRLCVLARLVPHKQLEHAVAAVALLANEVPGLHLDVIGEGWWHEQLLAEAAGQGVADRVTFHGHVPEHERDRLLGRAWLMLLPSVKEGWGLAVTEAGAQGTPTVGYRGAGGLAESVHDGETGVLVDDFDQMVAATRALLASEPERRRLAEGARRLACSLTWTETTDVVEELLGRVIADREKVRNRR